MRGGSFVDFQGWLADEGSASRNAGRAAEGRIGYSGDASHGLQRHLPAGVVHIKKRLSILYTPYGVPYMEQRGLQETDFTARG